MFSKPIQLIGKHKERNFMDDDEQDIGTGTHVEDSRVDPLVDEDDSDESLVDKVKDALTGDDDEDLNEEP